MRLRRWTIRNRAIGVLLLYTGLRVAEAERLDVDDVPMSAQDSRS